MAQSWCVITGAADGIGRALALHAAQRGWHVIGIDRDAERLQQTQTDVTAFNTTFVALQADLALAAERETLIARLQHQPPALLWIHNAGISAVGPFAQVPLAAQQAVIDVNLLAPLELSAAVLRTGCLDHAGFVVFLSSLSHYAGYPGASVYAATKSGLAAYARSLAVAYPRLHVLTVFPGPTRTAHARRYSPDHSREHRRMPPETVAQAIFQAVEKRQRVVIPGAGAKAAAVLGKLWPSLSDALMKRLMLPSR